jgi:hypothetical protein
LKSLLERFAHLFAAMGFSGLAIACNPTHPEDAQFTAQIGNAFEGLKSTQDQMAITTLAKFQWSTLHIFTPFTTLERIEASLGFQTTDAIIASKINERDDINLFVFVNQNKVVKAFKVSRGVIDLTKERLTNLTPSTAVFRKASNARVIVLASNR